MKYLTILQARTSSTRLPGKVLEVLNDRTMIEWQIARLQKSAVKNIVLATSNSPSDDELAKLAVKSGILVHRGSLIDVHSRFLSIVNQYNPQYFVRVTGDNPLFMPEILNSMISELEMNECDYMSNVNPPTYPDGLDIEIVSTEAFKVFSNQPLSLEDKEHVTYGLYSRPNQFEILNHSSEVDLSNFRWTVDYPEDLQFIRQVFAQFVGVETTFGMQDVLNLLSSAVVKDNSKSKVFRNISLGIEKPFESL